MEQNSGRCGSYSSAGSSKIKIRSSSRHKAILALCLDEVRILIFDDPAELERRKRPEFRSAQLNSIDLVPVVVLVWSINLSEDEIRHLDNIIVF